ncbi:MAG TPA: sortase, partial [Anaerolineales bacterium]
APGASAACTATNNVYTLTQADINAGSRANTATATGTPPSGPNVSDPDTQTTTLTASPSLNVVKEVSASASGPWNDTNITVTIGDTVYYRVRVENTGNITLTGLTVSDSIPACVLVRGPDITGDNDADFEVGEEWSYSCFVTAVAGTINNTATADTAETPQDSDTASYTATAALVVDPAIAKAGDPSQASVGETVVFTLTVTNAGNAPAPSVVVTDPLPAIFDVVSVTSVYQAGGNAGTISVTPGPAPYTVTVNLGTLNVTDVVVITITTTVNSLGNPPIVNTATVSTSAQNDPTNNNSAGVTINVQSPTTTQSQTITLPATGFAPNVVTGIPAQSQSLMYAATDIVLEIPSLRIKIPIVGVPKKNGTWDVSWLAKQAGWLEGTAFPSWSGNSVLTSHVYDSNGLPGPFVNLNKLKFGDSIIIHAYGQRYIFEVRTNQVVDPKDESALTHEERSWLTLITCKEYDERTNTYKKRVVVRAVLVSVKWD